MSNYTIIVQKLNQIISWMNSVIANKKEIKDLDLGASVTDTDEMAVSIGGITKRVKMSSLASYVSSLIKLKENPYTDINAMLAAQVNQTEGKVQYVEDSFDDTGLHVYAYYEKLDTSTASIGDYRRLSAEEVAAIQGAEQYNSLNVDGLAIGIDAIVGAGGIQVEYENVGDTVTAIHFNPIFSGILKGFADLLPSSTMYIKLVNTSQNKTLIAKITSIAYTDVSNTCYRVEVSNTMSRLNVSISDKVIIEIDVSSTSSQPKVIGGFIVNTTGNTDVDAIEAGNVIHGTFSAGRYIIARVDSLPYTVEANLSLYLDVTLI